MNDPSSMEIHKIVYHDADNGTMVYIDVSANNKVGAKIRKTFLVSDSTAYFTGVPNLVMMMYQMEDPFNGIMCQLKDGLTKDELNDVYELIARYESTQDKDVFK